MGYPIVRGLYRPSNRCASPRVRVEIGIPRIPNSVLWESSQFSRWTESTVSLYGSLWTKHNYVSFKRNFFFFHFYYEEIAPSFGHEHNAENDTILVDRIIFCGYKTFNCNMHINISSTGTLNVSTYMKLPAQVLSHILSIWDSGRKLTNTK